METIGIILILGAPLVIGAIVDLRAPDIKAIEAGIKGMQEKAQRLKANFNIDLDVPKDFKDYWFNYRHKS